MKNIAFKKYHCLGRDFVLLDNRDGGFGALQSSEISRICERRFGVGASGVLRLDCWSETSIGVKSFNFNGGLAELNAVDSACIAVFVKDLGLPAISTPIEINNQIVHCNLVSGHENTHFVNVRIPYPIAIKKMFQNFVMDYDEAQFCMIPTDEVNTVDVVKKSREIAYGKRFPKGANVVFYQPHQGFLEIRHYECQIDQEAYTNGLCVIGAALSHAQNNPSDKCLVRTKGGDVQVSFLRSEETFHHVELQVLVNAVYNGSII